MQDYINRGLEDVVRSLFSTEEDSSEEDHTVGERAEAFLTEAQEWLVFQFLIKGGQVRAELLGCDLKLVTKLRGSRVPRGTAPRTSGGPGRSR